jgi:hypothetical protein
MGGMIRAYPETCADLSKETQPGPPHSPARCLQATETKLARATSSVDRQLISFMSPADWGGSRICLLASPALATLGLGPVDEI